MRVCVCVCVCVGACVRVCMYVCIVFLILAHHGNVFNITIGLLTLFSLLDYFRLMKGYNCWQNDVDKNYI